MYIANADSTTGAANAILKVRQFYKVIINGIYQLGVYWP